MSQLLLGYGYDWGEECAKGKVNQVEKPEDRRGISW